jgi:hypothetical protein
VKSEVFVLCSQSLCHNDRDVTHKYRNLDLDFALNAVVLKFSCDGLQRMHLKYFYNIATHYV